MKRIEDASDRTQGEEQLHQGQTGPATRNLTIVWDDEKQAMLERIQALEIDVADLKGKLQQLLESYRTVQNPK